MQETLSAADNAASLIDQHIAKSQLRFLTCGSVDDGKSTLIGRLLYDAQVLTIDQIERLHLESRKAAPLGDRMDFSILLDGLSAEREQGITIDVAYRFFSTQRRSFIVADCPGHEQYTRNMVTGASNCELAILLVDARKGILQQTRRHALIAIKLGIRKLVLAVNKMDMVDWSQQRFDAIVSEFQQFTANQSSISITPIPVSGLLGENITQRGANMAWYRGPALLEHLESVSLDYRSYENGSLRIVVQGSLNNKLDAETQHSRWITGFVASGVATEGAMVRILPSGRTTRLAAITIPYDGKNGVASGKAITFALEHETDCGRGDLVCAQDDAPQMADSFIVDLVWMGEEPLVAGQRFWLKIGANQVPVTVSSVLHRLDINSGEQLNENGLDLNALGQVVIEANRPIVFETYANNRTLGGLILIDRQTNATVAAGMIVQATNLASENLHWQFGELDANARAALKGQTPLVVWLSGLSGAGKSTIANLVEKQLYTLGHHTYLLEGDNLRYGLNRDLGFSSVDRTENIRRAGEVAHLMADSGLIVIAAFISPFASDRKSIRAMMPEGSFIEVHVDVSLDEAERRDPKGLYKKARSGMLKGFTGIDSPYEQAEHPEIYIDTQKLSAAAAADVIVAKIRAMQKK
jgi:bifunctional enzyme CysN/CysC